MKKLLILNTDPKEFSYGGVCPFMRNMHEFLDRNFELQYMYLPDNWKSHGGSVRIKYLFYLWLHRGHLKGFDFILSHSPEGSYMASFSGIPYAHIYHGNSNPMSVSRYKVGKVFAGIWNKMFNRIEKTAALLYSVGPIRNKRQKKLYNPLQQDVKPRPYSERKGFVFAGRLESVKNIDRLIKIYAKLPQAIRHEHPFYIVGYGTLQEKLMTLVKQEELIHDVIFLGKVDNTQMLSMDSTKQILLMASSTEGFPTAIAEAFSVGVPVISTNVGDIAAVVKSGENGILLPLDYKDEDYIAAITDILDHYEQYAEKAYQSSIVFNAESITQDVINDISGIING